MVCSDEILNFWFGPEGEADYASRRRLWFSKDPEFDREIRERFLECYELAVAGKLDDWKKTARSCLALIILLDQFPRNMFRGTARSFATDAAALVAAQEALAAGLDEELPPIKRMFAYMPFEHSENLDHQRRCVELMRGLVVDPFLKETFDSASRHMEIIARFGRFPHRNAMLGRASTPEEEAFLKQPGSGF